MTFHKHSLINPFARDDNYYYALFRVNSSIDNFVFLHAINYMIGSA